MVHKGFEVLVHFFSIYFAEPLVELLPESRGCLGVNELSEPFLIVLIHVSEAGSQKEEFKVQTLQVVLHVNSAGFAAGLFGLFAVFWSMNDL